MGYCTTDELLDAMFGRFNLDQWKGIPESVKQKLYNLPDHLRDRILDKQMEIDGNDLRHFLAGDLNPARQAKLNNSRGDITTMMNAAANAERLVQAMGGRQKGQMLGGEAMYAAHRFFMERADYLMKSGASMAEMIRGGNEGAMQDAVMKLNELMAIGAQMTGNASEVGRALRWMRNIKEAEKTQKNFAQLFGTFEC